MSQGPRSPALGVASYGVASIVLLGFQSILAALPPAGPARAEPPAATGTAANSRTTEVLVSLSTPGPTISPELYGQFLSRRSYGFRDGIWAQKLRDRKFLLEPGKAWELLKPEGADFEVFHDSAGAHAGSPCLALWVKDPKGGRCGIRQGGLSLGQGSELEGYAVLAHAGRPGPVELRLSWGPAEEDGQTILLGEVGREYRKIPFRFKSAATTQDGAISLTLPGPGYLWVAGLSLLWTAFEFEGLNGTMVSCGPSHGDSPFVSSVSFSHFGLDSSPVTRWHGGVFVSGYEWKDGIGDHDRRPPHWDLAWSHVEDNDFGVDEFLRFSKRARTAPYITIDTRLGSVEDAADLVEYVNGSPESPWGSRRAANGHPEPHGVEWWGIGNEMYGNLPPGELPAERHALRHIAFVEAMKAKDPTIKIVAVGTPGAWNDALLPLCAEHMDLLGTRHYTRRGFRVPFSPEEARKFEDGFIAYSGSMAAGIRGIVEDLRKRLGKGNPALDRVRLALDEWGIVRDWNSDHDAPRIGAFERYCMGDAVAVARGLHEILRSADVVGMVTWAQAVDIVPRVPMGRAAGHLEVLDPVGTVLALYRETLASGDVLPVTSPEDSAIDGVAAWTKTENPRIDGGEGEWGRLTMALVNFHPRDPAHVRLRVEPEFEPYSKTAATIWRLEGNELGLTNQRGEEARVVPRRSEAVSLEEPVEMSPFSVAIVEVVGWGRRK